MVAPSQAGQDFQDAIKEWGQPIRIRYFTFSYPGAGSYYDDDVTLTKSGNDLWISGVVHPIDSPQGSEEHILLQQGLIKKNDLRLYVAGSIDLNTAGSTTWKVGLGSPNTGQYALTDVGVVPWSIGGTVVYQKAYVRFLPNGSLAEE